MQGFNLLPANHGVNSVPSPMYSATFHYTHTGEDGETIVIAANEVDDLEAAVDACRRAVQHRAVVVSDIAESRILSAQTERNAAQAAALLAESEMTLMSIALHTAQQELAELRAAKSCTVAN